MQVRSALMELQSQYHAWATYPARAGSRHAGKQGRVSLVDPADHTSKQASKHVV